MLKEFREFAMKGNVVDLAVGVIIGAAFGGIVKAFADELKSVPYNIVHVASHGQFSSDPNSHLRQLLC